MKSKGSLLFFLLIVLLITTSCKKYLDRKPNSNVQVPATPDEFQGLLDNPNVFGYGHALGILSADEFYFTPHYYYNNISESEKNAYIWKPEIFGLEEIPYDWQKAYEAIYNTNIVLEGLRPLMTNTTQDNDLKKIKGDALFKRTLYHFQLAQLFAPAYEEATAGWEPGIPLKLKTDAGESVSRPNLRDCFERIMADLGEARNLLQDSFDPGHRNRASKAAVLALEARIHLYTGNWQLSAMAAQDALKLYGSLIDYNSIDNTARIPIKADNKEVVYSLKAPETAGQSNLVAGLASPEEGANVDTGLIRSFVSQDLRLLLFYRQRTDNTWTVRTSLAGTRTPFVGISSSEIYLTLAEAGARLGNTGLALTTLNNLLVNRYTTAQVPPLPPGTDRPAVLQRILDERRKELAFHGLRWMDIKRLNKQNEGITQYRKINGTLYSIAPNDLRYALPLPIPTAEKYGLEPNER